MSVLFHWRESPLISFLFHTQIHTCCYSKVASNLFDLALYPLNICLSPQWKKNEILDHEQEQMEMKQNMYLKHQE